MKRAVSVLLMLALTVSLTACMSRGSMQLKRADRYFDDLSVHRYFLNML